MRKSIITASICGVTLLAGCQLGDMESDTAYNNDENMINVVDRNEDYNENGVANGNDNKMNNFGYVRHQKSKTQDNANIYDVPMFDREVAADTISKLAVQIPNVNDAAALVTDEEVFVAYETDTRNRFETADQVKKTALSVIPRYYHVYVSDKREMIRNIERFGQLDSNSRNIDQILDSTIKEMRNSAPQGRQVSDGENANGEMIGETMDGDKMNNQGSTKNYNNMNNR